MGRTNSGSQSRRDRRASDHRVPRRRLAARARRACGRCSPLQPDLEVVGRRRGLRRPGRRAPTRPRPQVVVTDIRMPPNFQNEGIEAAKLVRKRNPGTGVVVLSQYDEPEYAISLLVRGRGRLRVPAEGPRRRRRPARAARCARSRPAAACSTPRSSTRSSRRRAPTASSTSDEDQLLQWIAEGRPVKAIAAAWNTTPEAANDAIEDAVPEARQGSERGTRGRAAPAAPAAEGDRRPRGAGRDAAAGCCRAGSPRSCAATAATIGETERLDVTVLMSDVRGYSGIAERVDPTVLAGMLNTHRAEMNAAILAERRHGDAVRRRRGDGGVRRTVPAGRPRRPRARGRGRDARTPGRGQRQVAGRRARPSSGSASVCRPARSRPRCSAPTSGSSTRSSATR